MEHSITFGTYSSYSSSVRKYLDFCNLGETVPFPVTELTLVYFCIYRIHKVKKKTVFKDLYAIKKFAGFYGYELDFTKMYHLNQLKTGMSKCFGDSAPNKRVPITLSLIAKFLTFLDLNDYNHVVMLCIMVVALFGLLRTSEFAASNQKVRFNKRETCPDSFKALWVENLSVVFDKDGKIDYYKLLIRASKTDVFRQTVTIILGKGLGQICPVFLLTKMINMRTELAKKDPKLKFKKYMPLFIARNGTIITKANVTKFLKTCLDLSGVDSSNFTLYSFRIGGATMYARRGFNDYDIQMLGRWQSAAYKTYIRKSERDLADMSTRMVNTPICKPNAVFLFQEVAQQDLLTIKS